MATRSMSVPVQSPIKSVKGLRRLRRLSMIVALCACAALPFELGAVQVPAGLSAELHKLPVVGKLWPASPSKVATITAVPVTHTQPAILSVSNFPRTALIGHTEQFSVRIAGLPYAWLTYVLRYPDGSEDRAGVRTDATGFSSHMFRLHGSAQNGFRVVATIRVRDASGRLHAMTRFAIQKP